MTQNPDGKEGGREGGRSEKQMKREREEDEMVRGDNRGDEHCTAA